MRLTCAITVVLAVNPITGTSLSGRAAAQEGGRSVPVLVAWQGQVKLERRKDAPQSGYIADQEAWQALWTSWRGVEPAPWINFDEAIILVAANRDPNRIGVTATLDDAGDLRVVHRSTLIAFINPTEFAYQFALIRREGIKTIGGKPIASP